MTRGCVSHYGCKSGCCCAERLASEADLEAFYGTVIANDVPAALDLIERDFLKYVVC
jgi:hypothetical protein